MTSPGNARTPEAALQRALLLLAPIVRLLLRSGVDHTRLSAAMKRVFLDEAQRELARRNQKPTHTALSLLTGLQRKDVKRLVETAPEQPVGKAAVPTLAMQVLARWAADPRFENEQGEPRELPLRVPAGSREPSFDALVRAVSRDVHAPAVADELQRLGLVERDGALIRLLSQSFVPSREFGQLLDAMARNGRDHLQAAVTNVLEGEPRFLEYSLVADELRPESAQALHDLARKQWRTSYRRAVMEATERVEADRQRGFGDAPEMRVRYGVYFYSEPLPTRQPEPPPATEDLP